MNNIYTEDTKAVLITFNAKKHTLIWMHKVKTMQQIYSVYYLKVITAAFLFHKQYHISKI